MRRTSRKAVLQMKLMCSFIERSLSRWKPGFLTESEKEMVAWQIERGAGGCLSFEELKSIVLSCLHLVGVCFQSSSQYVRYTGLESVPGVIIML